MALDFTLLTAEQIWGGKNRNGQLEVMKKYGTKVAPTDLAIILGGSKTDGNERTSENELTCGHWLASSDGNGLVRCVDREGYWGWSSALRRDFSVRPVLPPVETAKLTPTNRKTGVNGVEIVEYGEYPQMVADKETSTALEITFNAEMLKKTGKNYTFDSRGLHDYDSSFEAVSYPEYELDGKKYIRILGRHAGDDSELSTGKLVEEGKPYWVEVQPIWWLMDESGWMVSKRCLFAGIQFDTKVSYDGDFKDTFMKRYLDTYFAKEMGHEEIVTKQKEKKEEERKNEVLMGLSAQLEQAINGEAVKAIEERLRSSEKGKKVQTTPERLHEAAMIKRLKKARDILLEAHAEAQEKGDSELADSIVDLARPYSARYAVQQNKVRYRRAKRKQGGRG